MYREIINQIKYIGFIKESGTSYVFRDYVLHMNKYSFFMTINSIPYFNCYSHEFEFIIPFLNKEFKNEIRKKKILSLCGGGTI